MNSDSVFYTATMAKVHANQGNLEKAVEIYQYLLAKGPEQDHIKAALYELESRLQEQKRTKREDLVPLIVEWIDLAFRYHQLQRLIAIRKRFGP